MNLRRNLVEVPAGLVVAISLLALTAVGQEKKESGYAVGPGAVISITNNYGPINVKPSGSSQVVVETISHSDAVSLVNEQHGDRIELRSMSSRQGTNLVDYTVLVPAAAFVTLHNVTGPSVEVNSGAGRITYDGDPGRLGDYLLSSHTGNLEVSIPASAWVEIKARSIKSQSDPDFPNLSHVPAIGQTSLLGKPGKMLGSRFELRSFSGKIHLKRP